MDLMTVYRECFTVKKLSYKPQTRRIPDYSCKECAESLRNKMKFERGDNQRDSANSGDGDKVQLRKMPNICFCCRNEIGDGHKNRTSSSDKVCDDKLGPVNFKE